MLWGVSVVGVRVLWGCECCGGECCGGVSVVGV